jgi:hypothetical protein
MLFGYLQSNFTLKSVGNNINTTVNGIELSMFDYLSTLFNNNSTEFSL